MSSHLNKNILGKYRTGKDINNVENGIVSIYKNFYIY